MGKWTMQGYSIPAMPINGNVPGGEGVGRKGGDQGRGGCPNAQDGRRRRGAGAPRLVSEA